MNAFLTGPGFRAVCDSFVRPQVWIWSVLQTKRSGDLSRVQFATRDLLPVAPHADLATLLSAGDPDQSGAIACVNGFDPHGWTRVTVRLWHERPAVSGCLLYSVGHLSQGLA